jgi:hypothetical protein
MAQLSAFSRDKLWAADLSWKILAVDAVRREPVSARDVRGNREKYWEFFKIWHFDKFFAPHQ